MTTGHRLTFLRGLRRDPFTVAALQLSSGKPLAELVRRLSAATAVVLAAGAATLTAGCTGEGSSGPPAPAVSAAVAWRALAPAPSERTEVAAAALAGRVYVVGGYRADGAVVGTVEVFDTASGGWSVGPELPVAVNHAMATTAAGRLYVFGGYRADGSPDAAVFALDGDSWRPVAPMPQGRAAATAVAAGDRVYVAGGIAPDGLAAEMLVYDPAADRWSTAPGPPTRREHLGGAGYGGLVYTVGGRNGGLQDTLDAFEAYDPATGRWTVLPALPTPRGGLGAAATCSGLVVAVGGEARATFPEAEVYDVRAGTWRALPPVPTPRHGLGVVAAGTTVYTFAGGPRPNLHVADVVEAIDLNALGPCR